MITSNDMKDLEEWSEQVGITSIELMENAGRKVAEYVDEKFLDELKDKRILVVCGHGNNGGDGLVAARYLYGTCKMDVLFLGDKNGMTDETLLNFDHLKGLDKDVIVMFEKDGFQVINFGNYDIVIDAMVGLGIQGELQYPYSHAARCINASKAFVVCVDVPSGINADIEGKQETLHVRADAIITFHDTKPGLKNFGDKVKIVDIGIPF